MTEFGSRLLLSGVAGAVFIAAVDDVKVPPSRAFDALANVIAPGSGASVSVSQSFHSLAPPPEIIVIDQNTGARRVGPMWLAPSRISDHSKERVAEALRLSISMD